MKTSRSYVFQLYMLPVFRVFSVISFVCSLLYALYHYTIGRRLATNTKEEVLTQTCATLYMTIVKLFFF